MDAAAITRARVACALPAGTRSPQPRPAPDTAGRFRDAANAWPTEPKRLTRSACGGVRGRSSVRSARARAATDRPIAWNHYKAARTHLTIDAAHDTCGSGRSRPPWVAQPVLFEFRSPAALSVYPKRARRLTQFAHFRGGAGHNHRRCALHVGTMRAMVCSMQAWSRLLAAGRSASTSRPCACA